jgi:hypothetical protein
VAVALAGCGELEVTNPNAPERERAFSDPATIVASAAGTMKTWVNTRNGGDPALTMTAMADHVSMSWNNWNARYYSSYGVDCAIRCGWVNSTSTQLGNQVQPYWYGMYSVLSSANDALFAIRKSAKPPELGADKARIETIAQMAQAMAHAWIAINYDQGFIVLEDTDPLTLQLQPRLALRDKAMELFEKAYALANGATFNTGGTWFGTSSSPVYSSKQLTKIIRSMQAELLLSYPRNSEENAQVNWGTVANLASQGISSATAAPAFDFEAYVDENFDFFSSFHNWANDYSTTRVDTRVGRLVATNQRDPWPGGGGDPQPNAGIYGVDKRVGDGCFDAEQGVADLLGLGECKATANSGTDFMWSPVAIFIPGRGSFHQSNIGYIRDHCLAAFFPDCPSGAGPLPIYSKAYNDLMWAEALIRSNGSLATAAQLINNSRVGRGGLPPVSADDGAANLLKAAVYEYEIELFHTSGGADFYFRRRLTSSAQVALPEAYNRLWPDTPRHMPVPAKDLLLLRKELYSFGGPNNPGGVAPEAEIGGERVKNVREIYAEMEKAGRAALRARRRH